MVYVVRVDMTIEGYTYAHICNSLEDSKRIAKKIQELVQKDFKNSRVKYSSSLSCSVVYEDLEVCNIDILIHNKKDVELHVSKFVNGEYKETRRFSTRENAVNFVHRVLDSDGFEASADEDISGVWVYHNESNDEIEYIVYLAVYKTTNKTKKNDYFEVLGVKPDATDEMVKKAYRQKIKKHHPDTGGDMQDFLKIQEAYENIINGFSKGNEEYSRELSERYNCISFDLGQNKSLGFGDRLTKGLKLFIYLFVCSFCMIFLLGLIGGNRLEVLIVVSFQGAIFLSVIETIREVASMGAISAIKIKPIKK